MVDDGRAGRSLEWSAGDADLKAKDKPAGWNDSLDLEGWADVDLDVSADVPASSFDLDGGKPVETFHLDLHVHNSGLPGAYEYQFEGKVTGDAAMSCVRCLADMTVHFDAPFSLRYLPISSMPLDEEEKSEVEILEKDVDIEYYRRPVFDLLALVREQVYLGVPMGPICREDCAGLCPNCGTDRNLGPHACTEKKVDPRWEALASLKLAGGKRDDTGKKSPS